LHIWQQLDDVSRPDENGPWFLQILKNCCGVCIKHLATRQSPTVQKTTKKKTKQKPG